jgi:hypothetical protein
MAERNGAPRSEFRDFPFRVLFVFKTAERRNNTARDLIYSNPPIREQVLLTTMSEFLADPLGSIWIRPLDYLNLGLPESPSSGVYRRQTGRDALIESQIVKHRLLVD